MEHLKNLKDKIVSKVFINKDDTDIVKAKKSIRLTFVGSIIAIFIIAWIAFALFTFSKEVVKVPNIENDNIYIALNKLSDKNLIPKPNTLYSETYKEGRVFNQKPAAGTFIKQGRIITFNVSFGSYESSLPDFRGYTLFYFDDYLKEKYPNGDYPFKILPTKYEFNEKVPANEIVSQEPPEGTFIKGMDSVQFVVSLGVKKEGILQLPNFVGKNMGEASEELTKMGLKWSYFYNIIEKNRDNLLVTEQSIGEGMPIDRLIKDGTVLTLTINKYNVMENRNKIVDFKYIELPYKAIPYEVEFRIREKNRLTETSLIKLTTFGGVSIPVEYSAEMEPKFFMYIDGAFSKEIDVFN